MRFLPIVTQVFLWGAVFAGMERGCQRIEPDCRLSATHDMVAYYLLAMVGRAFSSMPGLASGIALQIRNGEIKKYLVQPIDLIGFLFLTRVAHKLVYYGVALVPFAIAFYLFRGYFSGWPPCGRAAGVLPLAGAGVPAGLFHGSAMGLVGFWTLEVSSLLWILHVVQLLSLRPHVSAEHLAGAVGYGGARHPAAIPGVFSGGGIPGEDHRGRDVAGPGDPGGVDRVFHRRVPRGVSSRRETVQRVWRLSHDVVPA